MDPPVTPCSLKFNSYISEVVVSHSWEYDEETGTRKWVPVEYLGVRYAEIIPVLVNAIQELADQVGGQQDIIEDLSGQLQQQNEAMQVREQVLMEEIHVLRERQDFILRQLNDH